MFVCALEVDFLIDSFDICTASLSRPEIPGTCQPLRGNLDVSIVVAGNSNVIAIDEVQRAIFLYSLGISSIDLGCPADILQSVVNRIACDDVGIAFINRTICIDVYPINDVSICFIIRRLNSSIGSICQFDTGFLELCDVDSVRISRAGSQTCQLAGILEVKKISIFIRFPSSECFVADGHSPQICMPHGGVFFSIGERHSCTVSYIIIDAFCICFPRRAGSIAQCNTIGSGCFSSHTYGSRVPASCLGACTKSSGPGPGFGVRAQGSGIAPGTAVFLTSENSLCPICVSLCTDGNRVGPFSALIIIGITDSNGIHTFRFGIVAYGQSPFTISIGTIAKSCCPQTTISIGTSSHCDGIQSYGAVIVIVACSGNIVRIDAEIVHLCFFNFFFDFCFGIVNSRIVFISNDSFCLIYQGVDTLHTSNVRQSNAGCFSCFAVFHSKYYISVLIRFVDAFRVFCRVGNDTVVCTAEAVSKSAEVNLIGSFSIILFNGQDVAIQFSIGYIAVLAFYIFLETCHFHRAAQGSGKSQLITADGSFGHIIFPISYRFQLREIHCVMIFGTGSQIRNLHQVLGIASTQGNRIFHFIVIFYIQFILLVDYIGQVCLCSIDCFIYNRFTGYIFQGNFIPSSILNDIAVSLLFSFSGNQGGISCRDFISIDGNIIPLCVGLTSLDVVGFTINFKAGNIRCTFRCTFRCFYGFHFRACREVLKNFLSIRRVGNTDIGILTIRSSTISKGQCPIDSRAGRTITVAHERNSCRGSIRAHIYRLNIVMIERKVIVPQDVEVFLVFGYPVGIHRSASVIDFSAPIAIIITIRFFDRHQNFIIFPKDRSCINFRSRSISEDTDFSINDIDIAIIDNFSIIRICVKGSIPS